MNQFQQDVGSKEYSLVGSFSSLLWREQFDNWGSWNLKFPVWFGLVLFVFWEALHAGKCWIQLGQSSTSSLHRLKSKYKSVLHQKLKMAWILQIPENGPKIVDDKDSLSIWKLSWQIWRFSKRVLKTFHRGPRGVYKRKKNSSWVWPTFSKVSWPWPLYDKFFSRYKFLLILKVLKW